MSIAATQILNSIMVGKKKLNKFRISKQSTFEFHSHDEVQTGAETEQLRVRANT